MVCWLSIKSWNAFISYQGSVILRDYKLWLLLLSRGWILRWNVEIYCQINRRCVFIIIYIEIPPMIFDLLVCLFAFSYITSGSNTSCLNAFRFQPHSWPTMDLIFRIFTMIIKTGDWFEKEHWYAEKLNCCVLKDFKMYASNLNDQFTNFFPFLFSFNFFLRTQNCNFV